MLLSLIACLAIFFTSLGMASKYFDSVADRIAPDLRSGTKPYRPVKLTFKAFLRRLAEVIVVLLALALWIRGSIALRYALAAVVTIGFAIQIYLQRLKPLFARGATPRERGILLLLNVAGALSLGSLLLWSARQGHVG